MPTDKQIINSKKSITVFNFLKPVYERQNSFVSNSQSSTSNHYFKENYGRPIKISAAVLEIYNKYKQQYQAEGNTTRTKSQNCDEIFRSKSASDIELLDAKSVRLTTSQQSIQDHFDATSSTFNFDFKSSGSLRRGSHCSPSKKDKQTSVTTLRKRTLADKQTSVTTLLGNAEARMSDGLCSVKAIKSASFFEESAERLQRRLYIENANVSEAQDTKESNVINYEQMKCEKFSTVAQPFNNLGVVKGSNDQSNIGRFKSRSCFSNVDGICSINKKQVHFLFDDERDTLPKCGNYSGAASRNKKKTSRISHADKAMSAFEKNEERRRIALETLRQIENNAVNKTAKNVLDRKSLKQIVETKFVDFIEGNIALNASNTCGTSSKPTEKKRRKNVTIDSVVKVGMTKSTKGNNAMETKAEFKIQPRAEAKSTEHRMARVERGLETITNVNTKSQQVAKVKPKIKTYNKENLETNIQEMTAAMEESCENGFEEPITTAKTKSKKKYNKSLMSIENSEKDDEPIEAKINPIRKEIMSKQNDQIADKIVKATSKTNIELMEIEKDKNIIKPKEVVEIECYEDEVNRKKSNMLNKTDQMGTAIEKDTDERVNDSININQNEMFPDTLISTLKHLRPRERSPLIEGFQRENSNLYVVDEVDENIEESEEARIQTNFGNAMDVEENTSAETFSSTGNFIYKKPGEGKLAQLTTRTEEDNWEKASKKFAAQIADVFKRDAEQWLEEMKDEISVAKLIATTQEIEATNTLDAAFSEEGQRTQKQTKKFRKAKSSTISSIGTTSTDVKSLPPEGNLIKHQHKKIKHISTLDRIEILKGSAKTEILNPVQVNIAALSKVYIKCPDSACKRNMKLAQFGWHMAVEHFSTLKMDYLALNEVGHLNILVANVCWATRRPIKLFMIKNMVVDIGCRFYNKYLPIVTMVRPVHCNEIYNRPLFGEPLTEEYLMIWFTGITLKARPLSIQLTLRNGETSVTKTVSLYSIKKNQCLLEVYVSGSAILITHELITKLTRGENLILRGEIIVK